MLASTPTAHESVPDASKVPVQPNGIPDACGAIAVIPDTMLVAPGPGRLAGVRPSVTLIEPRIGTACAGAATSANATVPAAVKNFNSFNMAAPREFLPISPKHEHLVGYN